LNQNINILEEINMKKLFASATLVCSLLAFVSAAAARDSLIASSQLVWVGLDYSHARLIGPGQFNDPDAIFPGVFESWNNLFLQERIRFVEKETKKDVTIDIDAVTAANQKASSKQIIESPGAEDTISGSLLTPEVIGKIVKSYDLKNKSGTGVVFIVDRLVKLDKKGEGAVFVVAFDIATRAVIFSERETGKAGGFGFRNYWFRVIKDAEKGLKQLR
jgi:hypothetical protein